MDHILASSWPDVSANRIPLKGLTKYYSKLLFKVTLLYLWSVKKEETTTKQKCCTIPLSSSGSILSCILTKCTQYKYKRKPWSSGLKRSVN